jgi:hypothetical protein
MVKIGLIPAGDTPTADEFRIFGSMCARAFMVCQGDTFKALEMLGGYDPVTDEDGKEVGRRARLDPYKMHRFERSQYINACFKDEYTRKLVARMNGDVDVLKPDIVRMQAADAMYGDTPEIRVRAAHFLARVQGWFKASEVKVTGNQTVTVEHLLADSSKITQFLEATKHVPGAPMAVTGEKLAVPLTIEQRAE